MLNAKSIFDFFNFSDFSTFSTWSARIAGWLGESQSVGVEQHNPVFSAALSDLLAQCPLSSLLPYETYDPDSQIFINKRSCGWMLEVAPLTGATPQTVEILGSLLTDVLPVNADCQCLLWASDKIGSAIDQFAAERSQAGETFAWLAQKRAEFLKQGTLNSLTHSGSYILRDFRLFLIVSIPLKELTADTQSLIRLREDFVSSLNSLQMATRPIPITHFISLLTDLLNPSRTCYPAQQRWNEYDALAKQVTDPEYRCQVYEDHLTLSKSDEETWAVQCFSVRDFPESVGLWQIGENLGQLFNAALQIPCPFAVSFHIRPEDSRKIRC